jgi:hypothetical protein
VACVQRARGRCRRRRAQHRNHRGGRGADESLNPLESCPQASYAGSVAKRRRDRRASRRLDAEKASLDELLRAIHAANPTGRDLDPGESAELLTSRIFARREDFRRRVVQAPKAPAAHQAARRGRLRVAAGAGAPGMGNRQEVKIQTRGPDEGNPTPTRQGHGPGAPGHQWRRSPAGPAKACLVEVIGA